MAELKKTAFSLQGFYKLMNSFPTKFSGTNNSILKKDWKEIARNEFALTPDQEKAWQKLQGK
jgi:hypothetical protein